MLEQNWVAWFQKTKYQSLPILSEKKTKIENVLYAGNPLFCSLLQEDEKSKTQITEIFSGAILDPLKQEIIFFEAERKVHV